MPQFEWDESLTLGDAMIDRQHKSLLDLINRVDVVRNSPDMDKEIMNALTGMYLYAKEHFFDEEALMDRLDYPERQIHMALHKDFVDKTHALTDAYLNDAMKYDDLRDYLVTWLKQHISSEDAKIVAYANIKGELEA